MDRTLARTISPLSFMALISALVLLATGLLPSPAIAQSGWQITKLNAASWPEDIVTETRRTVRNGLPDGLVTRGTGRDIAEAWYASPTGRYDHGILGDAIEAGSLHVRLTNGRLLRLILPRSEVFEDRAPRLADLDGNGTTEIITIRSSVSKGASVTVYGINNLSIVELATTGFYGRKNRWLNIAAIAPFLGIRGAEIAFVQTPHIGGSLFILRYIRGTLVQVGAGRGFSNHVIGSREMRMSAVADVDGDGKVEVALPSEDRKTLRIVGTHAGKAAAISDQRGNLIVIEPGQMEQGGLKTHGSATLPAAIDKAIGIQTKGRKGFVVGLENGDVYLVHPG